MLLVHVDGNLFERLLMLLQMFLSRHSQEPELLPLTDQLTELWGLGVEVLQWYRHWRLHLQRAPSLWMSKKQQCSHESDNKDFLLCANRILFPWGLTCERPFAGGSLLFRGDLVLARLCGMFNLWKLFIQLLHEYLQGNNNEVMTCFTKDASY